MGFVTVIMDIHEIIKVLVYQDADKIKCGMLTHVSVFKVMYSMLLGNVFYNKIYAMKMKYSRIMLVNVNLVFQGIEMEFVLLSLFAHLVSL